MLRALEVDARVERVHFVASENSLRVMAEELGLSGANRVAGEAAGGGEQVKTEPTKASAESKIVQHANSDIGAAIASGSYPSNGMIVLPCSMGTLAAIANGLAKSR